MTDLNEHCRIQVLCIATNRYGSSKHYFNLYLNSSESRCIVSSISPSPSVTLVSTTGDKDKSILGIVFPTVAALVLLALIAIIIICVIIAAYKW